MANKDQVVHPSHYNSNPSGIEAIEVLQHMSFNVGSAMKYLWRADFKDDPVTDLRKAREYIDFELKRLEEFDVS